MLQSVLQPLFQRISAFSHVVWTRGHVLRSSLVKRYPFDVSVRDPENGQYPTKKDLFGYFEEVRILYRQRLEPLDTADFGRQIADEHFGKLTV